MSQSPGRVVPSNAKWKPLLRLHEQLVSLPTSAEQSRVLSQFVESKVDCQAKTWLAFDYYPLPGEHEENIVPSISAPELVNAAFNAKQPCFSPPMQPSATQDDALSPIHEAAFPLISNNRLLGILYCQKNAAGAFTFDELSLIEEIVDFSSSAFEIRRQQVVKDWRLDQLTLVSSVSRQIVNQTDVDQLSSRITKLIQEFFDFYYVAIFTLDTPEQTLTFRAFSSQAHHDKPPVVSVKVGVGMVGCAAKTGEECIAADVSSSTLFRPVEALPETRSEIALPLKIENRILGVLDVQSERVNDFHENDIMVLRALADNIAIAIEGARLYQDLQRRADQLTTIHEVSRALISILDLDRLLEEVVKVIQNHFGFPYVHIFTVHKNRGVILYRAGSGSRSLFMQQKHLSYLIQDPTGIIPWVAREKKTVLANDVTLDPRYRPSELPPDNTQAELTIPLLLGEEILGILDIQSDQAHIFKPDDLPLFEALCASITVAIRNATLYQSERWRLQVSNSLREVAYLVSINTPIDQLLRAVLDKLEQHLNCHAAAIWLISPGESKGLEPLPLNLAVTRGISSEQIDQALQQDALLASWLSQSLFLEIPSIRLPGQSKDPLGAALQFPDHYSALTIPLRSGNQSIGIVLICHPDPGRYGSDAQSIAATFAGYAAASIMNARLFQEAQEQAVISTLLLQVAEASQVSTSLDDLLSSMVSFTRFLTGIQRIAFLLYNEQINCFILKSSSGIDPSQTDQAYSPDEYPALERLKKTQQPQLVQQTTTDLAFLSSNHPEKGDKILLLPLHIRGNLLGAYLVELNLHNPSATLDIDESRSLSILQGIAHQAAIAIDNIRLEEARQEEAYVSVALLQVAQTVAAIKDLSEILDHIVHLLPMLVGIDACLVYLWDAADQKFVPAAANTGSQDWNKAILSRNFNTGEFILLDQVYITCEPQFCEMPDEIYLDKDWQPKNCLPIAKISKNQLIKKGNWLMGFPLAVQGRALGALIVMETDVTPIYRERRIEIIMGIAQQTAIAIENDRLQRETVANERIDREIQLARQIQQDFLPDHIHDIPGWELDTRWRTAREVGGDFYDVFPIKPGYFGIVIADVADKGMPAALYMAVTRTLIRAYMRTISSPARLLDQINDLLLSESTNGMFITAIYGVLETATGIFTYANAGHNLPLIVRRNGRIESLNRGGIALGVVDDSRLVDQTIKIHPGDLVYFYTDGVTDTTSPNEEYFGEDRLKDILLSFCSQGVKTLLSAIDSALLDFSQAQIPSDDITMLAISCLKQSSDQAVVSSQ